MLKGIVIAILFLFSSANSLKGQNLLRDELIMIDTLDIKEISQFLISKNFIDMGTDTLQSILGHYVESKWMSVDTIGDMRIAVFVSKQIYYSGYKITLYEFSDQVTYAKLREDLLANGYILIKQDTLAAGIVTAYRKGDLQFQIRQSNSLYKYLVAIGEPCLENYQK